jgi:heat shock protein HslJ
LTAIDGQVVPEGVSANVLFTPAGSPAAQGEGNAVNGSAGCNNFFGSYSVAGDTLTAGPFGLTQMMCEESAMRVEQAFLAGLEDAQNFQITRDQLVIETATGSLLLYADRFPLEGPQWILTGSGPIDNPQPPIEGGIFTANFGRRYGFPSGTKSGRTGCRDYTATYYASSDQIKVNLPKTSQVACTDAQLEAEQGYFLGLNAARDYRILGNELYVYFDNNVLIFVGNYQTAEVGPLVPLDGTQWRLTSIGSTLVVPNSEVTILFEINSNGRTGKISGSGGCNTYNADIRDVFVLGPISNFTAICDEPEGMMEQESAYLEALQNANDVRVGGNQLRITTDQETLYFMSSGLEPGQPTPTPTPEALTAVIKAPSDEHPGQVVTYDGSLSIPSGEIISYNWWFSDGSTSDEVVIERTYDTTGAYDAILTVTNADGQKSEASVKTKIHTRLVGPVWVLEGDTITLSFDGSTLSGFAGCNDYSAGYASTTDPGKSNSISVGAITTTGKECDGDTMEKEQTYLANLEKATSFIIEITDMVLTTPERKWVFNGTP